MDPSLNAGFARQTHHGGGPTGFGGMYGAPGKVRSLPASYDPDLARRLWEVSEELTGVRYRFAEAAQ